MCGLNRVNFCPVVAHEMVRYIQKVDLSITGSKQIFILDRMNINIEADVLDLNYCHLSSSEGLLAESDSD